MKHLTFKELDGNSAGFYTLIGIFGALILIALGAAYYMEHNGHYVTGMDNQVVWGMPHIFAIFLILSASGVLNVASIGSVFRKAFYHPLARISGLLAITLLIGGLSVLVLDLGRPDRLIVAMTSYNFKSIFAWNIFLYNGFLVVVGIYVFIMMNNHLHAKYYVPAGLTAFVGRFVLTTGTGSIFGFLVAREAFNTAILAPLFITLSLALGMAVFLIVLIASCVWTDRKMGVEFLERPRHLLGLFISAAFYFVLVYHLTNLYVTGRQEVELFVLSDGGIYTILFWFGYVVLGTLAPLAIIYLTKFGNTRDGTLTAAALVLLGGFSLLYVIIIGGQAYPLDVFPNMEVVSSGFSDGIINEYSPSIWEFMLGLGGIGIAMLLTVLGMRILPFLFLPSSIQGMHVKPEEID